MILPITLIAAGAAGLINLWLSARVGSVRQAEKVSVGDGGNLALIARMRAHANFVEYTPFVLVLIGVIELAHGTSTWLWVVTALYLLSRVAHGLGMDSTAPRPLRVGGILVTMLVTLGLALYALATPFLMDGRPATTELIQQG